MPPLMPITELPMEPWLPDVLSVPLMLFESTYSYPFLKNVKISTKKRDRLFLKVPEEEPRYTGECR